MSEQAAPAAATEQAASGRLAWAALMLARDPTAMEALAAGLPVPRRHLRPGVLAAVGEAIEGPDVALDDELALRLDIGLTGTEVPEAAETVPRFPRAVPY